MIPTGTRDRRQALVSVADHCDVGCPFCLRADRGKAELSQEVLARVLSRLRELGVIEICFTGGEPTDHQHFLQFCRLSLQFGIVPSVVTSARTPHQVERLIGALKFLGHVTVSADSSEVIRRYGGRRTIASALEVLDHVSGPTRSLHLTADRLVEEDNTALRELAGTDILLEVSPLVVGVSNRSASDASFDLLEPDRVQRFAVLSERLEQLVKLPDARAHPAGAPTCSKRRYYVSAEGMLRFCPYEKSSQISLMSSRAIIARQLADLEGTPIKASAACRFVCAA